MENKELETTLQSIAISLDDIAKTLKAKGKSESMNYGLGVDTWESFKTIKVTRADDKCLHEKIGEKWSPLPYNVISGKIKGMLAVKNESTSYGNHLFLSLILDVNEPQEVKLDMGMWLVTNGKLTKYAEVGMPTSAVAKLLFLRSKVIFEKMASGQFSEDDIFCFRFKAGLEDEQEKAILCDVKNISRDQLIITEAYKDEGSDYWKKAKEAMKATNYLTVIDRKGK